MSCQSMTGFGKGETLGDKFRLRTVISATVNGSEVTSDQTAIPTTGLNSISVEVGGTKNIETLLSLGASNLLQAAIYDFKVTRDGVIVNEIPLANKAQGATQIATVGSVNATMINYTPDVWEEV